MFNNYLFRAHSIGNIMGGVPKPLTQRQEETYKAYTARKNGQGKPLTDNQFADWGELHKRKNAKVKLNDSAKKYLDKLVWDEILGRRNELKNKFLDKGILSEEKSFTLLSNQVKKLLIKNRERKENDFITGEADLVDDVIREVKSSWSYETFPLTESKMPSTIYEWQQDGYMWLWDIERSELIYILVDTPFRLVEDELRRMDWKYNLFDISGQVKDDKIDHVKSIISNHIFTRKSLEEFIHQSSVLKIDLFEDFKEVPASVRFKIFHRNRDRKREDQMRQMILLAREYMNSVYEQIYAA